MHRARLLCIGKKLLHQLVLAFCLQQWIFHCFCASALDLRPPLRVRLTCDDAGVVFCLYDKHAVFAHDHRIQLHHLAPHAELAVYSALDAPEPVQDAYLDLLDSGELPVFADAEDLVHPWGELSSFCTENGVLSGWFLIDHKGEGCHLAGLYVLPAFRGGWTAAALITRSIRAAKAILPPETEVWASAIDRNAFSLCDKLLRLGDRAVKETEFRSVYTF